MIDELVLLLVDSPFILVLLDACQVKVELTISTLLAIISFKVSPLSMVNVLFVPIGSGFTVIVLTADVELHPDELVTVYVISVVPADTGDTIPLELTVATLSFEEVQIIVPVAVVDKLNVEPMHT